MRYELAYGQNASLSLELSNRTRVEDCRFPTGEAVSDVSGAVVAALAQPLEFPPLTAATVAGDKVAIVIEPGVCQFESVVAGAVQALLEGGTEPRDISVVVASNLRSPLAQVPKALRPELRVVTHNPADHEGLQYLAADKQARPIYLNRAVCEADLLLPITIARHAESLGYVGGYSGIFPTFADTESQRRFQAPSTTDHSTFQKRRRNEVDEAAWLLGVQLLVQVVPGAGDHVLGIIAGEANAVAHRAEDLAATAWQQSVSQKSSMAITAIDGGPDQQTWENLARGLHAAMQVTAEGGAIVLLTELQSAAGRALARLASAEQGEDLHRHLEREHSPDAHAAAVLADARERFDVYLLSGLQSDLVEAIGLGFVEKPEQLQHLAESHPSVALIGCAQYANCALPVVV